MVNHPQTLVPHTVAGMCLFPVLSLQDQTESCSSVARDPLSSYFTVLSLSLVFLEMEGQPVYLTGS